MEPLKYMYANCSPDLDSSPPPSVVSVDSNVSFDFEAENIERPILRKSQRQILKIHPLDQPTMSTRRSTRATSKPLSDVSAAPSATTRTPRRTSTRKGGPSLPAIGTRTSNSYGTNTVIPSGRSGDLEVAGEIGDVLDSLQDASTSKFSW